jgi:rubrerythrin
MENDIGAAFLAQLAATAGGRRYLLSVSVEAEEGDEGHIFDQLADRVDDPRLRRIVARHRDDERRHAQLFGDCLRRLGLERQPVPDELRIVRQVAEATGGFEQGVGTDEHVVATYALLRAIEVRGVEQYPLIADAFDAVDPVTAEVYRRVVRDERGHVRYCDTIGGRYAGDDATWQRAVADARAVEEAAFAQIGLASLTYCAERGWVDRETLPAL